MVRGAGVDLALSRPVKEGALRRVRWGLNLKPPDSRRAGDIALSIKEFVQALVSKTGETITVHGATAANRLGLLGEVSFEYVYLTSGKTRILRIGHSTVSFMHASSG